MSNTTPNLRSLEFQGKNIYYVATPEANLVLIRPLCEALGIDADRQIRDMKTDEILGGEVSEMTTRLPSEDRSRPYTCLPEEYIYGWIFQIKMSNTMASETKVNLIAYKRDCYHALYQHFHGKLIQTHKLQKEEAKIDLEIKEVEARIKEKEKSDPDRQLHAELTAKKKQVRAEQTKYLREDRQIAIDFAIAEQSLN